jgi:3-oxoacyl-[acyl-carrier protein] reductase
MELQGRIAMVTGASRRIGRATALGLAGHGADVILHARHSRGEIEAVAAEVRALGRRAHCILGDVADEASVEAIFAEAESFGAPDILVNNAAIRGQKPFREMTLAEWRAVTGVVLDGAFLCSREALKRMAPRGFGVIVNIGGVTAHIGADQRAHVSAAKAGLVGLTKALAVEFAPHGVTVNCVAPGKIGGERSATSGHSPGMGGARILLGREGEVDEAAFMVVNLCLPGARFMTGQTVHVSGGLYLP